MLDIHLAQHELDSVIIIINLIILMAFNIVVSMIVHIIVVNLLLFCSCSLSLLLQAC